MVTIHKFFKHSNSGDLINSQEFTETPITGLPIYWYRDKKRIDIPDLKGYVEMSEKKWKRLEKKAKR